MTRLARAVGRAFANVADRAMRTDVPMTYGRICPGGPHGLDFNCREITFENGLQLVQCATCGIRSTWAWDAEGPILTAHQVRVAA